MEIITLTEEQRRRLSARILEAHYLSMQYDAEAKREAIMSPFGNIHFIFKVTNVALTDKKKLMIEYINYGEIKVEEI